MIIDFSFLNIAGGVYTRRPGRGIIYAGLKNVAGNGVRKSDISTRLKRERTNSEGQRRNYYNYENPRNNITAV